MGRRGLMLLWRLSGVQYASVFDGGYGLLFEGRWNTAGHAVTYGASSPSLCVLEKLVHVEDPTLLPAMIMVVYDVPDALAVETIKPNQLPAKWQLEETHTQRRGDAWHRSKASPLLSVPSVIVPFEGSPDVNFLINHSHPDAAKITIKRQEPFTFDPRLF
jgi:RES domain-containing protein